MDGLTTGAGLGALGFWLFVAAIIAVGVWDSIRKRDAQHETLRRVIESGETIDDELVDKLLALTGGSQTLDRDLRVAGILMFGIGPSLAVFGLLLSLVLDPILLPILASVGVLLLCLGAAFMATARFVRRWNGDDPRLGD